MLRRTRYHANGQRDVDVGDIALPYKPLWGLPLRPTSTTFAIFYVWFSGSKLTPMMLVRHVPGPGWNTCRPSFCFSILCLTSYILIQGACRVEAS
jgi:hypothetical protein